MIVKPSRKKWLVLLGCFCINFTLLGIQRSSGVLYVALLAQYGSSREEAAWPSGVYSIIVSLVGPLAGLLAHYWSIRTIVFLGTVLTSLGIILCYFAYNLAYVTIFYGAVPGIGTGLIITLTHVIINQHFLKNRATAAGFAYAGSCIGSFVFPPVTEYLLENFSLRGTFLLLGGIALHSLLGALLYFPANEESAIEDSSVNQEVLRELVPTIDLQKEKNLNGHNNGSVYINDIKHSVKLSCEKTVLKKFTSTTRNLSLFTDVLSDSMFIIICTTFAFYFLVSATYLMIIVDFAMDRGIEESKAVFLISVYSAGDLSGRLCTGWMADSKCVKRKYIVMVTMLFMGVLTSLLPTTGSYWPLIAISTSLGTMAGCTMINFSALMTEYIGVKRLPIAIGLATFVFGIVACIRPGLVGHFRDKTGTYDYLLYMLGAVIICGSGLWLLESIINRYCRKVQIDKESQTSNIPEELEA